MYHLRIVVEEIRGFCDLPMKVGDFFEIQGGKLIVPAGKHICMWALAAMLPMFPAKQRNIVEENDWLPSTQHLCCPDPNGMVIYRIERQAVGQAAVAPGADNRDSSSGNKSFPRMLVDESCCSGCRACEMACSFHKTGMFGEEQARIRIAKDEAKGLDCPTVCRQCGTAGCVQACPVGALQRHPQTHAIVFDEPACIMCGKCSRACPFGSVHFSVGKPVFCDLCQGDPCCVERCSTGALRFGRAGEPPVKGGAKVPTRGGAQ